MLCLEEVLTQNQQLKKKKTPKPAKEGGSSHGHSRAIL